MFSRKKKEPALYLGFARKLVEKINFSIKAFCKKLTERTEKYSLSKKKFVLVFFCIAFSGISIYIASRSLFRNQLLSRQIFPQNSKIPGHIGKNYDIRNTNSDQMIKVILDKMHVFQNMIDSLNNLKTKPGK